MHINDILTIHNVAANANCESKKSVLELISKLAVSHIKVLEKRQVLSTLVNREKLGSTAVGSGVALPHGRIKGIEKPVGVLVTLHKPIDFDAPDSEPVDILFGLLTPVDATTEHLDILALLAEQFNNPEFQSEIRHAENNNDLLATATSHAQ